MMNSKLLPILLLVTTCLLSSTVAAGHEKTKNAYYAYGEVITAEPIIRHTTARTPRTECHPVRTSNTSYRTPRKNNGLPTLIGGLLGGIIGHQFGGGNGKTALTIAGTFAGASIANSANRRQVHYIDTERCTVVHDVRNTEKIEGYLVTYRYHGKQFTRTMDDHPGSKVRIRIQVEPVNDAYASNLTPRYPSNYPSNYQSTYTSNHEFSSERHY